MRGKETKKVTMALAGTPNVGKSAIFHQMTGADVIVSNYPGTTVELLEGRVRRREHEVRVIDLPGVYSLGAVSEDELVARRAILELKPDVIVNIVDASNPERGLYLTLQLLELGYPMLVVLNMYDVALNKGTKPDPKLLSKRLGVPVVATVAIRGENVARAFDEALKLARKHESKKGAPDREGHRGPSEGAGCEHPKVHRTSLRTLDSNPSCQTARGGRTPHQRRGAFARE